MAVILDGIHLGCQSWCYRDFRGIDVLAKMLRESNLDRLELCSVHCDFSSREKWQPVIEEIEKEGIRLNSFGVNGMPNKEDVLRSLFEFAKAADVSAIGADPDMEAIELIDRLADEYGIKVAVHNHGKYHRYGFENQLDDVFVKSKNIGLCLDTGWALEAGIDPVYAINKYADRLYGVHLKDFTFDADGRPEETVLGTGVLDLKGVIDALDNVGFTGYASLEYEGDASNPVPKITACVANLELINA